MCIHYLSPCFIFFFIFFVFISLFMIDPKWKRAIKNTLETALSSSVTRCAALTRPVSYRLRLPHVDGRADACWLALSSPVHFFHHTVHVASREAMEKHGCRRGDDIITVLFGSASQDVHQRRKPAQERLSQVLF